VTPEADDGDWTAIRPGDAPRGAAPASEGRPAVHVGRRTVLGVLGLTGIGIFAGARIDGALSGPLSSVGGALGGLGALVPGADSFRIYTVTAGLPDIDRSTYRLKVNGLVDRPAELSLDDLAALPRTSFSHTFQCVTGWRVPNVHWQGVRLADLLDHVGAHSSARALRFYSADGTYTESLTMSQAHLPDVLVADHMLGTEVSSAHGGPVRLYGYKSIKWLDRIEVTDTVVPGYWEDNGYPLDAWIGGQAP
jgi:DMSO/TMAO reductase YedYZ molybdopterin-dependent catalytic subunit